MSTLKSLETNILRSVNLFAACSDKELAKITRRADQVTVVAGTELFAQGSFGAETYVILSGAVKVEVNGVQVAELTEGSLVGEFATLDHHPRSATVTATTNTTLLVFGVNAFNQMLAEVPSVNRRLLADLALRLRNQNTAVA
jgi:CRP/FNR family transcriptional regulator, cyclic AMP receptor protein